MAVAHVIDDEQELIDAIHELAVERVAPRAAEIDHTGQFPWDMQELLAQQDILAMPFPTEYGGLGSTELAVVMAIEELSRYCATTGLLLRCINWVQRRYCWLAMRSRSANIFHGWQA